MTCSTPAAAAARAIGASLTNWGRAPTTERIFTPASVGGQAARRRRAPSLGRMRILVVTTWFPTASHLAVGAFVARDVAALATRHDVRVLHLVSPALADDGGPLTSGLPADDGGAPPGSHGRSGADQVTLDLPGMDPVTVRVRRLVTD